jgi:hypothetical protein
LGTPFRQFIDKKIFIDWFVLVWDTRVPSDQVFHAKIDNLFSHWYCISRFRAPAVSETTPTQMVISSIGFSFVSAGCPTENRPREKMLTVEEQKGTALNSKVKVRQAEGAKRARHRRKVCRGSTV